MWIKFEVEVEIRGELVSRREMRIEMRRENKTETTLILRIENMSTCEKYLYCSERIIDKGKGYRVGMIQNK
jgi:hypothetical protein